MQTNGMVRRCVAGTRAMSNYCCMILGKIRRQESKSKVIVYEKLRNGYWDDGIGAPQADRRRNVPLLKHSTLFR
jgi:hypothetical protein